MKEATRPVTLRRFWRGPITNMAPAGRIFWTSKTKREPCAEKTSPRSGAVKCPLRLIAGDARKALQPGNGAPNEGTNRNQQFSAEQSGQRG